MILILSHPADDHAKGVLARLARRKHPATLLDSSDFPARATLSQSFSSEGAQVIYTAGGAPVDLGSCYAAWWRRPLPYTLHDGMDPAVTSFAYTECHEAFGGALALLKANWVNPPHLDERAHHKPLQLAAAVEAGLSIPQTLITNDPEAARQFIAGLGFARTIYKTFLASEEHWRETRVLREDELAQLDTVSLAPVIFQEYVAAEADIRVTVTGDRMFATAIRPGPASYAIDFRMDMAAAVFEPTYLPDDVAGKLRALMRSLGLVYGAADFRRTPAGDHVFLEVNPAGEWMFVEERTGQPITEAMADLLIRLDQPPLEES